MAISVKRVLIGLSGGIDSAYAAYLLQKQGFEVEGVFMKNWSNSSGLIKSDCPWLSARRSAISVAAFLGIKLHTIDFEDEYKNKVMNYFIDSYKKGFTPSPDVYCNKEIKFKLLYNFAMEQGYDYLASGHYADIKAGKLERSLDDTKDQTYFLSSIKKEVLNNILFPLANTTKELVKKEVKRLNFPNYQVKESMGVCFVGKFNLKEFLLQYIPEEEGDIVTDTGEVVGRHSGVAFYTIGQRDGLDMVNGPWYVVDKDVVNKKLIVSNIKKDKKFEKNSVYLSNINLLVEDPFLYSDTYCKYRHQGVFYPCRLVKDDKGVKVVFQESLSDLACGQNLVVYHDKTVLLGGDIWY